MERNDSKFMLMSEERVYYDGLIGRRMMPRSLGAVTIYVAPQGEVHLKLAAGPWRSGQLFAVAPFTPHQVTTDCGRVLCILLEPERLDADEIARLVTELNEPQSDAELVKRVRQARTVLQRSCAGPLPSAEEFDRLVLGRTLKRRSLDRRIEAAFETLQAPVLDHPPTAGDCARRAGLSVSRFLHLFKEETGISCRNHRMWKRARSFLYHASQPRSLTEVALGLGYPDSSHFSHSMRKTYGLKPRSMRIGSIDLNVQASPQPDIYMYA